MIEKCKKYESMFVFGSEEDLEEHLKTCPNCQKEHDEMNKVSNLVKEVAPFIKRKNSNNLLIKVAAGFIVLFLSFLAIDSNQILTNKSQDSELALVKNESVIAQMGLPTDEYGLLVVER